MNKKQWIIPLSAVMMIGLTGCTGDNRASVSDNNRNTVQPMGYYSNENHPNRSGNGLFVDNDGPVTEFMDHTFGNEGKLQAEERRRMLQTRDENGNPPNPTKPLAAHDNGLLRDNRFSMSDTNYHGHMNHQIGNAGVVTDAKEQDRASSQIRNRVAAVKNVRTVRSVIYGNSITISVNLNDNKRAAETKREIEKAAKPYANGRSIQVVTDDGAIGRYRNSGNHYQQLNWPKNNP